MVNRSVAPRSLYYQALFSQALSLIFLSIVIVLVINSGDIRIFLIVSSFWLLTFGFLYFFLRRFIFLEIKNSEVFFGSVFFKEKAVIQRVGGLRTILGLPYQGIYSLNISKKKYFFFASKEALKYLNEYPHSV